MIPSSIQRIQPLPELAAALLSRLPLNSSGMHELQAGFAPDLIQGITSVALHGEFDISDFEQIHPATFAEIAITILIRDYLARGFTFSGDRRYWRYTVACAVCCAELGPTERDHGPLCYAAGLLHDIGRLAVIAAYPDKYSNLLSLADRMFAGGEPFDMSEHERILFGLDHFAAGSWLAAAWKLPPWLLAVVGKFDAETPGERRDLVATVRAGTRLAHSLGFGYLSNAPRGHIRAILGHLPAAWAHWKALDQWQFGEEYMRAKIQSRLSCYAGSRDTDATSD